MWERKELKSRAKDVVKKNYWTAIVICFLIAFLTGEFGTSVVGLLQGDDSMDPNYVINKEYNLNIQNDEQNFYENQNGTQEQQMETSNTDKQNTTVKNDFEKNWATLNDDLKNTLNDTQLKVLKTVEDNFNSATKSQKYIFKIYDAVMSFNLNKNIKGVTLCIGAIIAFAFTLFIADPLIVGGKRYFLKARVDSTTKIGVIKRIFARDSWINVALIMFLRNLFNALWDLTIIGGIIKTYEYRMIPYILAENPNIKRKEAFKLSKQMMKGNKWKTFVLDISFWGWNVLSIFTFGLLSILYVNPYNAATNAELYMVLRKNAIQDEYEYFEKLNDTELV